MRCPDCHQRTSTRGRCPQCRAEHVATGVDPDRDPDRVCAGCGEHAPEGGYSETRRGMWFCPGCSSLGLRRDERRQVATETTDALNGAVQWAVGDDSAFPDEVPVEIEAGFETASTRLVADGGQQFEHLPTPDRFFQAIGDAEVEMEPMDRDDVRFKTNHVPGGRFAFELTASYSFASYDCRQIITLDREGAEALRDRLDEVLENDRRGAGGGA